MHDDVIAVQRNLPPAGDGPHQCRAGLVLFVGPLIPRLSLVFDPDGVEIWIDARVNELPGGPHHGSGVKSRVGLLDILLDAPGFPDAIVRRNRRPRIGESHSRALERSDDDVDDDGLRREAAAAFAKIPASAADPLGLHRINPPLRSRRDRPFRPPIRKKPLAGARDAPPPSAPALAAAR